MPERFDEADQITNADVWNKFNYTKGQWELWKDHVSRKYNIQPTDQYTAAGFITRGVNIVPEKLTPIPDVYQDALGGDPNKAT